MWSSKDVYYISDSTGILAETMGQALLCHFPAVAFYEETFPFIGSVAEAKKVLEKIMAQSSGLRPLVFSSIMDPKVQAVFDVAQVEMFDVLSSHLDRLELVLEARALRAPGFSHNPSDEAMDKRVEAIHFSLNHDDGTNPREYDEADVIILGVSRAGKTPVSVYLATHMGLKAANLPLTEEYLARAELPDYITSNRSRAIGITTNPEQLHAIREKRMPDSTYAALATCRHELGQALQLYLQHDIPYISSSGKSIEELAAQICKELGVGRK
ncbi:MAG: pyruvate, water dikinase regulatory protein [Thermodesulfobacteriota bacterium]